MALAPNRLLSLQIQQKAATILGRSGPSSLSFSLLAGQSGQQNFEPQLPEHNSDSPGLNRYALFMASSDALIPDASLHIQKSLLYQLFNGSKYRDLQNLNLHARLPQLSKKKASLIKWQQEFKHFKNTQP